ncbi:MAG: Maf family protein [Candidatus Dojkabacteria bacterium]|jgi:septum formation protein|nr:Maf family protein [Candidatus Dojkabacteria bacterium]
MQKIILATTSKFRIKSFEQLGLDFEAMSPKIDEKSLRRPEDPKGMVLELAKLKAESVAIDLSDEIVVGCDTVGVFRGEILEKVGLDEARKRLSAMSGESFSLISGICILNLKTQKTQSEVVETNCIMRSYSDKEVKRYMKQDNDISSYAISFAPGGLYSCTFIKSITGSYTNLTKGIPLERIVEMLPKVGYNVD